jgi:hypothetical protein
MQLELPNELRFELGGIISIASYEYEDGGEPTNKILIVLHKGKKGKVTYLTFTLTTSQLDKQGITGLFKQEGCVKLEAHPFFHFYFFKKGKQVGNINFAFQKDTVILFNAANIRHRPADDFKKYTSQDNKLTVHDVMNKIELKALIDCLRDSIHITPDVDELLAESLKELAAE